VVLATREGMSIHFRSTDVRPMGRATRGVRGIDLTGRDAVVSLAVIVAPAGLTEDVLDAPELPEPEDSGEGAEGGASVTATALLTVCENGFGKATPPKDYRLQTRGGKGVIAIKTSARNGKVVALRAVDPQGEVLIVTDGGTLLRIPVDSIRVIGRNTQGVKLINVADDEKVVSFEHFLDTE
jgi:DNA gyrase subunit A